MAPRDGSVREGAGTLNTDAITKAAHGAGFDAVGFTPATLPAATGRRLFQFLDLERHATMGWMADTAARRSAPTALWPDARSIVVLGMNYTPPANPLPALNARSNAVISVYAQGKDYHVVVKKRAKQVARFIAETLGGEVKVFVDTAPVMEKPLGELAGIGWQGKHTNLVSRDHGSWLFLATVFTSLELKTRGTKRSSAAQASPASSDQPPASPPPAATDHCGACTRCLDICPTNAFPAPYQLDARRCISYLTIEHRGPIPHAFRRPMGNRVFGCDDCLAVCPWNKFASTASEQRFAARDGTANPPLATLLALSKAGFHDRFAGTPVKRTGYVGLMRNVLIAAGNAQDQRLVAPVRARLDDPAPVMRGAAVWALHELDRALARSLRSGYMARETDETVLAEWQALENATDG